jgi:hypothetical protein
MARAAARQIGKWTFTSLGHGRIAFVKLRSQIRSAQPDDQITRSPRKPITDRLFFDRSVAAEALFGSYIQPVTRRFSEL